MNTFNREQCELAFAAWDNCRGNYNAIKNLIPTNYVFDFDAEQINWMKTENKCTEFCAQIGIYENKMVAVLCPMDEGGHKKELQDYPYSFLAELKEDLNLVETEEYTLVKNAVLSKDLKTVDNSSDMFWPIANKPMMEQDKAIEAIESWRNDAMIWFYRECTEFQGARIFRQFYVPAENLNPPKAGLSHMVCSFGLKFSQVYQRVLPTLIFISFYTTGLEGSENGVSVEKISNTYDWSNACPPICQFT